MLYIHLNMPYESEECSIPWSVQPGASPQKQGQHWASDLLWNIVTCFSSEWVIKFKGLSQIADS